LSESNQDKIHRLVAKAVEARQHVCQRCGHDGRSHVFDFVSTENPNPCLVSCLDCMNGDKK